MISILFSGQGSQQENMGGDFYEKYEFSKNYYDNLESDLKDLILKGDLETLSKTKNTQPALISYQTMVSELLKNENVKFDYTAGLSIGEYASLAHSNVISSNEAIEIAKIRGGLMEEIGEKLNSKMVAVIGMDKIDIENILSEVSNEKSKGEISNLNCPGQIVVSGETEAIERFIKLADDKARRIIPINTSGPFHTSYLKPVEEKLREVLSNFEFKEEEETKVVYNLLGRERKSDENPVEIMAKQVSNTVRFQESIEYQIEKGVDTFVEVGFGNVLKGFVRKIDKTKKVYVIDSVESYEKFLSEVKND